MKKYRLPILCRLSLLGGCDGGSMGGSPSVTLSGTKLTFGREVVGTTSPAYSLKRLAITPSPETSLATMLSGGSAVAANH